MAGSTRVSRSKVQKIGLFLGPLLALFLWQLPLPVGMTIGAWHTIAIVLWLGCWWSTEAIPIPAASLLPIIMLPLADITTTAEATLPYAKPVIFLLLGGFIAAMAMQKWQLHRRIALNILARVGEHPAHLIAGFMAACALLSMWISNTATTLMIVPIALTVAQTIVGNEQSIRRFTIALLIGCAWASSIGGLGTIIGTPPNVFVVDFIANSLDREISFGQWMLFAVPIVCVMVPAAWLVLTKIAFPFKGDSIRGGQDVVQAELAALGPITTPEKRVAYVMGAMAFFWSFRGLLVEIDFLTETLPFLVKLKDTHIAVAGALAMFLVPAGDKIKTSSLLDWETATKLPWGVLLLFGGGMSLAAAIQSTGLAIWLGQSMSVLAAAPLILIILSIVLLVIFLTELTSNTATTAALVPVLGALATTAGIDPIMLAAPTAMAASCAFMLPVATGPNAVVFSTGEITVPDMVRSGIWLNILGTVIVTGLCYLLLPLVFG